MAQMTVGISVDHYLHVASQFVFSAEFSGSSWMCIPLSGL